MKKLIVRFMSKAAIPDGGGFPDAIKFLKNPDRISAVAKSATRDAFQAIDAVRATPDCKWTTDEQIAEQIVNEIEKRNANR